MDKLKLILLFFALFLIDLVGFAQKDTIRAKVISSITSKCPYHDIYIQEKNSNNIVMADDEGAFSLIVEKGKQVYNLEIRIFGYAPFEYAYQEKWIDRKLPKHIAITGDCSFYREKIIQNRENDKLILFISGGIAPVANTKSDNRFERKYKVKYVDFGCEAFNYECIQRYNIITFKVLDNKRRGKWRKNVRKDVIGIEAYR